MGAESSRLKNLKGVNLTSSVFLESKRKRLDDLIQKNAHLPDQGTKEWLDLRRFNIGGSEIGVVVGENKFSNLKKLVAGKVGLCQFRGVMATRWGKAFEKVTTMFVQSVLDVDGCIRETSSIPGEIPNQRYSPDGLAVVKMLCGNTIDGTYVEQYEYATVLFEFKSPYSSVPDGCVPKYYIPQVLAGLCSIPIADFGIFVNNMYRKCSLDQFALDAQYDKAFHNKDKGDTVSDIPIAMGFIIVYATDETHRRFSEKYGQEEDDESEDEEDILSNIMNAKNSCGLGNRDLIRSIASGGNEPIDFGESRYFEFNTLLSLFDDKLVEFHYCDPLIIQSEARKIPLLYHQLRPDSAVGELDSVDAVEMCKKIAEPANLARELAMVKNVRAIIGYVPYKLFKSDMIVVDRDPQYLQKYNDKVQEVIRVVRDITGDQDTVPSIHARFRKYYPHKNDCIDKEIDELLDSCDEDTSRYEMMVPTF